MRHSQEVRVGIDENGLGPRLGPLVVTGVMAHLAPGADLALAQQACRARLDDSKALVRYGDSSLGEAWARAILGEGVTAGLAGPRELLRLVSLDSDEGLYARCPDASHREHCEPGVAFGHERASAELCAMVVEDIRRLEDAGLTILGVRSAVVCVRRLNDAALAGRSRFQSDLFEMERLVLWAREQAARDVHAVCGKVGGYDRYLPALDLLAGYPAVSLVEGRERSAYRLAGVGTVEFVRDADAVDPLVQVASLVGKWMRDLLMGRIVAYHRHALPTLPNASGYHDPVTQAFVHEAGPWRLMRGLSTECFERLSSASRRPTRKPKGAP